VGGILAPESSQLTYSDHFLAFLSGDFLGVDFLIVEATAVAPLESLDFNLEALFL
jgi:hypothetical protein